MDDTDIREDTGRWKWWAALAILLIGLVIAGIGYGLYQLGGADQAPLERLRDIVIIFLAFQLLLVTVVLAGIAAGLVFLIILVTIIGFGFAMGSVLADQLTTFTDDAPQYIDDLERWLQDNVDESIEFDDLRDEFVEGGAIRDWAQKAAENALDFGAAILSITTPRTRANAMPSTALRSGCSLIQEPATMPMVAL